MNLPRLSLNQTGIVHLGLIFVLLISIIAGTILVQERTHIAPRADCEENCGEEDAVVFVIEKSLL